MFNPWKVPASVKMTMDTYIAFLREYFESWLNNDFMAYPQ